jgi:hypothetical protein
VVDGRQRLSTVDNTIFHRKPYIGILQQLFNLKFNLFFASLLFWAGLLVGFDALNHMASIHSTLVARVNVAKLEVLATMANLLHKIKLRRRRRLGGHKVRRRSRLRHKRVLGNLCLLALHGQPMILLLALLSIFLPLLSATLLLLFPLRLADAGRPSHLRIAALRANGLVHVHGIGASNTVDALSATPSGTRNQARHRNLLHVLRLLLALSVLKFFHLDHGLALHIDVLNGSQSSGPDRQIPSVPKTLLKSSLFRDGLPIAQIFSCFHGLIKRSVRFVAPITKVVHLPSATKCNRFGRSAVVVAHVHVVVVVDHVEIKILQTATNKKRRKRETHDKNEEAKKTTKRRRNETKKPLTNEKRRNGQQAKKSTKNKSRKITILSAENDDRPSTTTKTKSADAQQKQHEMRTGTTCKKKGQNEANEANATLTLF